MAAAKLEQPDLSTKSCTSEEEKCWRGATMEDIYRHLNIYELEHVPPVCPSDGHTVLYKFPIRAKDNEPPITLKTQQKWDAYHVRLPCSPKSQYPVTLPDGSGSIEQRWSMIEKALLQPLRNSHELQAAILSYNTKYEGVWNFCALHRLFNEELDESETRVFFEDLLPRIIRVALRLPELVQTSIPLLTQGKTHAISLTQQQIASLLANAFLCTYPRRNTLKRKSEYSTFPDINFNRLFQSTGDAVLEKIKCICHYFRRVCPTERDNANVPNGVVSFMRRSLTDAQLPDWTKCEALLADEQAPFHITSSGTIEDQGLGLLQVDFANKYLGGGVLGGGCVQEEIRFVICPELLVSKLFTECLRPTEALLMIGCERYSNYSGYAHTFSWAGNYEDETPLDSSRRRRTHIVAIDALAFREPTKQYTEELMLRELNKAYVGFLHTLSSTAPGVASGNWGCGAFGGDAHLKALLQLMACAATKRPLVYFTFGDSELRDKIHHLVSFLISRKVTVHQLWHTLCNFQDQRLAAKELYNFIYSCHGENPQPKRSQKPQITILQMFKNHKKEKIKQIDKSTFKTTITNTQHKTELQKTQISPDIFCQNSFVEDPGECAIEERINETVAEPAPRKLSVLEMLNERYNDGPPVSKKQCTRNYHNFDF